MPKAAYTYTTEGQSFAFLQDTVTAVAIGNTPAPVGTPRLPHKLKPGHIALRRGTSPGLIYKHVIADEANQATHAMGDTVTIGTVTWTIVGFDGEVNNAFAAY